MKPDKPRFSVILPGYNAENFVIHAIESVIKQIDSDWELILVDDASTDRTPELFDNYAKRYPAIRCFHNPRNLNIAASLNRGIEEARGEWMVRLDADDCLLPEYIKTLRSAIDRSNNDLNFFFSSWTTVIDEEGDKVMDISLPDANTIEKMMSVENFLYHSGTSFSKKAWEKVGGYPIKERTLSEDTAMWRHFLAAGLKLVMMPKPLIHYRIHYSNVTSINDARLFQNRSKKEYKAVRQYHEWRISLFLKQSMLKNARRELRDLWNIQKKATLKNIQYYLMTYLPASVVYHFMWVIRPRLRSLMRGTVQRKVHI